MKVHFLKSMRFFGAVAAFAVVVLMVALYRGPSDGIRDLLSISNKAAVPPHASWYAWSSPNHVLAAYGGAWSQVTDVNTATGETKRNSKLEQQLSGKVPGLRRLSPNGQWMYMSDSFFLPTKSSMMNIDGGAPLNWPYKGEYLAYWLQSSKAIVGAASDKKGFALNEYHLDTQKHTKRYLPQAVDGSLVGISGDDTLIFSSRQPGYKNWLEFTYVSRAGNTITSQFGIEFPEGANMFQIDLSPLGDKLAIGMTVPPKPNVAKRLPVGPLRRMLTPSPEWRLMIVDLNTHQTRYVGRLPKSPGLVSWVPDNQHYSYIFDEQIYVCDTNAPQ